MPIYEYQCQSCGAHVEKMQRITEPALTVCPDCGGELQKLVSLSSFHLKGNGWYVTDYKGKNPSNGNGHGDGSSEQAESATSTTAADGAADAKPKAETTPPAKAD